jgi:hypothetical protein
MLRTLALEHSSVIAQQGFLPVRHLRGVGVDSAPLLAHVSAVAHSHSASSATLLLNSAVNLRLFSLVALL